MPTSEITPLWHQFEDIKLIDANVSLRSPRDVIEGNKFIYLHFAKTLIYHQTYSKTRHIITNAQHNNDVKTYIGLFSRVVYTSLHFTNNNCSLQI